MIADLDRTIEQLLIAEMPIKNGEIDVKFEQPRREWSARLSRPTLNLFLYDVRENNVLRKHQWERMAQRHPQTGNGEAQQKRTPFRVDCSYMLTSWASEPQDEHRLLSRAMMALFRHPVMPRPRLAGGLQSQPYSIQARLASHDRLTNPAEVWGSLDNEMRPSVSYILTLAIDPWTEVSGPVVRTFTMRTGQADTLPEQSELKEQTDESKIFIGGQVTRGQEPQAGIDVAIKGTGLVSTTNDEGKFRLGGLPAGDYTLIAWPEEGKPKERPITVPAAEYDIEL